MTSYDKNLNIDIKFFSSISKQKRPGKSFLSIAVVAFVKLKGLLCGNVAFKGHSSLVFYQFFPHQINNCVLQNSRCIGNKIVCPHVCSW